MESSLIRWNLANWITVVLMVATMTVAVGFLSKLTKGMIPTLPGSAAS